MQNLASEITNPKSLYLVTGGAGFIGSNIVERLVGQGERVRVLDNFATGKRENLAPWLDHVELIEGDIRDPETVKRAVEGVSYVLHQGRPALGAPSTGHRGELVEPSGQAPLYRRPNDEPPSQRHRDPLWGERAGGGAGLYVENVVECNLLACRAERVAGQVLTWLVVNKFPPAGVPGNDVLIQVLAFYTAPSERKGR